MTKIHSPEQKFEGKISLHVFKRMPIASVTCRKQDFLRSELGYFATVISPEGGRFSILEYVCTLLDLSMMT